MNAKDFDLQLQKEISIGRSIARFRDKNLAHSVRQSADSLAVVHYVRILQIRSLIQ